MTTTCSVHKTSSSTPSTVGHVCCHRAGTSTTTSTSPTTSAVTTTSSVQQTTTSASSTISNTVTATSSSTNSLTTQTQGQTGHSNAEDNVQLGGNINNVQTSNTSSYSLSNVRDGISYISSSSLFSILSSAGNDVVSYAFSAYEIALVVGLAMILGSIRKSTRDEPVDSHGWRW